MRTNHLIIYFSSLIFKFNNRSFVIFVLQLHSSFGKCSFYPSQSSDCPTTVLYSISPMVTVPAFFCFIASRQTASTDVDLQRDLPIFYIYFRVFWAFSRVAILRNAYTLSKMYGQSFIIIVDKSTTVY